MGEQKVSMSNNSSEHSIFIAHLLKDIEALEYMLTQNMIEKGITRIGAEQEFCLVTKDWRPANNADPILSDIDDEHFTTELAKYNLEINLDPVELKENCFQEVQHQLETLLKKANTIAKKHHSKVVLTGILPTLSQTHLKLDYITDRPRYLALNKSLMAKKGNHFNVQLMGVDELSVQNDSVLFEACNTSFQMHLQIEPDDFISSFNWAQAIAGPILSICTNAPLLLGRELWSETRIALFKQSIDTRHTSLALKDQMPRVSFGNKWATGSIVDIYKDNIAQYKTILTKEIDEDSLELIKDGKIPKLKALSLHNGTIYPWNRACYGVGNGVPHLRIENRYIPAGPSIIDEMANFALWVGLMIGRPKKFDNMPEVMDFRDAKSNFLKAARYGNESLLLWDGKQYAATELLNEVLIPIAIKGLEKCGIDTEDINRYMKVIKNRINSNTNGSKWLTSNFRSLKREIKSDQALRLLTKFTYKNQQKEKPVSQWKSIAVKSPKKEESLWVGHVMTSQLLTVKENDLASLATNIMLWRNIHHMPVENEKGKLSGLLTWTHANKMKDEKITDKTVKEIMVEEVITTTPTTPLKDAIELMKEHLIGCLPVIQHNELIGIVTIKDVILYDN